MTQWWILEYYCPVAWGLPCTHGTSGGPGDIVINATSIREGFIPDMEVTMPQASAPSIIPMECIATIDGDSLLRIPYLSYVNPSNKTISLRADFVYEFNETLILFKLSNAAVIYNPSFSCAASTLSGDLTIHIPDVLLADGTTHLWADLVYSAALSTNKNTYFVVTNHGVVSN